METLSKSIKGVCICLLAIFLMSHNASALSNYDALSGLRTLTYSTNNSDNCNNTNATVYIQYIRTASFDIHSGNMVFAVPFQNSENNNSLDAYIPVNMNAAFYISPGAGASVTVLDAEVVQNSNSQSTLYILVNSSGSYSSVRLTFTSPNYIQMKPHECIENGFVTDVGIDTVQLQEISGQLTTISNYLTWINTSLNEIKNNVSDTSDSVDNLNDSVTDHYEQEQESLDNISNQDPSDLSGDTDNEASTNLIGLFQSFISALTNITQANNCNLSLEFPSYAGGTVNVNVCQNKDKGGNLVAIFSSLTLIIFYIPLALKLLSMIYNEIRSFTNG